mmetsp:Transcript_26721/g.64764  ORF Transcript_26721/g.64764 Transcript_26721/m.64764 type:complete len:234 (-) Transcript_26721:133-834(-)
MYANFLPQLEILKLSWLKKCTFSISCKSGHFSAIFDDAVYPGDVLSRRRFLHLKSILVCLSPFNKATFVRRGERFFLKESTSYFETSHTLNATTCSELRDLFFLARRVNFRFTHIFSLDALTVIIKLLSAKTLARIILLSSQNDNPALRNWSRPRRPRRGCALLSPPPAWLAGSNSSARLRTWESHAFLSQDALPRSIQPSSKNWSAWPSSPYGNGREIEGCGQWGPGGKGLR